MLTGPDLLAKVKELGDASKSELVRECGYVSTKKDGTERLNFTAFYEALLEAKGVTLGETGQGRGKAGRKLGYETKVQFNGWWARPTPPSWACSPAMSSRSSSAASRSPWSPSAALRSESGLERETGEPASVPVPIGLPH